MTSEEEDGETIYCICRSADVNRFMIGCDHCEEWYHGDCINVTEKESKYIKKFFCKECREKNSHLSIVYKSKFNEKQKEQEERLKRKEHKDQREKEKKKKKDKDRERDRSRDRDKYKEKHKDKEGHKDKDHDKERHKNKHKEKDRDREKEKERERQKAKLKVKEEIKEEPKSDVKSVANTTIAHSSGTTSTDLKVKDEKGIGKDVKEKEEKYKIKKIERIDKTKEDDDKVKKIEQAQHKRLEEIKKERTNSTDKKDSSEKVRKVLAAKDVDNITKLSSEDEWQPSAAPAVSAVAAAPQPSKPAKEKQSAKRKASKDTRDNNKKKRSWRAADYSSDESDAERITDMTPRQCYGMECINCARIGSKYCSDQCGLSLASLRIYQTLPERIREWNLTSCKSAEANQKELVKIRNELGTAREKLEEVDREVEKLEQLIAKSKSLAPVENNSEDSSDDDEQDEQRGGMVNCISCGKDVSTKVAIRHMESCFNKFESQTSYGSMYKTKIEGYQMVCDFYNPLTETYCKRLRVICPEHTKDPKIGDNDVCGFPLTKNIFSPSGEFCRVSKKECNAHFCWEKLRRGELDMERVRCWMKLDELMEQERQEKESLSRRAGVLNLMLHSTFNHEIMEKVMKMQKGKQGGGGGGGREDGQQQSHSRERQQQGHGREGHPSQSREVHGEHHQRKPERQPVAVITLS
eukprot:TRINITY_DN12824_c0_g1_i1.p1 TRINITY_DN12824_c0_g1~~TRINITY_DN12824_c0_g1_i1.p1  ORF type:complete len:692 (-),score=257.36 TRINITY_DN12824_c0_g1_i1:138-2213(-)